MPIVKVWCLPQMSEEKLKRLHQTIVATFVSIPTLGVKDESNMTNLFPRDMMEYGLGTEVVIEIFTRKLSGVAATEKDLVAELVARTIKKFLHEEVPELNPNIECVIIPWTGGFYRMPADASNT